MNYIIIWIMFIFNWRKALIYHLTHNKGMILSEDDKNRILNLGSKKV